MEENLRVLLDDAYNGKVSAVDAMDKIRREIFPALLKSRKNSILSEKCEDGPIRTLRGKLWALALGIDKSNYSEILKSMNLLTKAMQDKIEGELSRFEGARAKDANHDEFKFWLALYSVWMTQKASGFEQKSYVFGAMMLRNLNPIASFEAFVKLLTPIMSCFVSNTAQMNISGYINPIVTNYDKEFQSLGQKGFSQVVQPASYRNIASLFTQAQPIQGVEVIWDFLMIYGVHHVVYIESAWVVVHKEQYLANVNPTDPSNKKYFMVDNPELLIETAIKIHRQTSETIDIAIRKTFYGE